MPATTTTIEWAETKHDFGDIEQQDRVTHIFKFTNVGDAPLVILSAKGSCGCTVPHWPKVPVLPGESSEIEVMFDSTGKIGRISKRIAVVANTSPGSTQLQITGNVVDRTNQQSAREKASKERRDREAIEEAAPNCFAIFPNPTSNELQLELKQHIGRSATVEIRNQAGQTMLAKSIDHITRETTRFDVSSFPAGIYMIMIRMPDLKPVRQCFVVAN